MTEVSKIQKWGNSQGIRIPKKMLETLNLKVNDSISIEEEEDCLKIKKIETQSWFGLRKERRKNGAREPQKLLLSEPIGET